MIKHSEEFKQEAVRIALSSGIPGTNPAAWNRAFGDFGVGRERQRRRAVGQDHALGIGHRRFGRGGARDGALRLRERRVAERYECQRDRDSRPMQIHVNPSSIANQELRLSPSLLFMQGFAPTSRKWRSAGNRWREW
jgi:hypothetical protein